MRVMRARSLQVLLTATLYSSCKSSEEELLVRFLQATEKGDDAMVASLSMVAFPQEPSNWQVLGVGEEHRGPYRVPELRQSLQDAEHRRDAQFKEFGEFRQTNYDDLASIQKRLRADPQYRFSGRLGELQRRWDAYREERREVVANLQKAEQELEWEIRRVAKSLERESAPEYLDGETITRQARVRVGSAGQVKLYVVTLTRYDVKNQLGAVVPTRWIVTEVAPEG